MFREQSGEANGFIAKFLPHQFVPARRFVTFIEKQIQRLQYRIYATGEFADGRNFEGDFCFADFLPSAHEAFLDGRFATEKGARNFGAAESAKGLQRERDLCFFWNQRVTAHKDHSQALVFDFLVERGELARRGFTFNAGGNGGFLAAKSFFATQNVQRQIFCGLRDPGRRIFRNAVIRPRLQGP